jgi:hypothetical protein
MTRAASVVIVAPAAIQVLMARTGSRPAPGRRIPGETQLAEHHLHCFGIDAIAVRSSQSVANKYLTVLVS